MGYEGSASSLTPTLDDRVEDDHAREQKGQERGAVEPSPTEEDPENEGKPQGGDDDHLRRGQGTTVGHSDQLLAAKELCSFAGEVGEDEVGSRTLDREEALHHDALSVDPSIEASSLDHRIFATDLIGSQREVEEPSARRLGREGQA